MSRREEIERLKRDVILGLDLYYRSSEDDGCRQSLDRLVELALESLPTRYTPREEVTEGWCFATMIHPDIIDGPRREAIEVKREPDGNLAVYRTGWDVDEGMEQWTDFLPVPAWCVEGIKSEGE